MSSEPAAVRPPAPPARRKPRKRVNPPALELAGEGPSDDLGHVVGISLDSDLRRLRERASQWEPRAPR